MENRSLLKHNFKSMIIPLFIIAVAALLRLLPHPANVAPIAAMALFGGVYLDRKYAFILPLSAMIISDIFLGFSEVTPFVYVSFILTSCIGFLIRRHKKIVFILSASLLSSLLFFLITNFGVWLVGGLYPKTLQGLLLCFNLAIPLFRNTLIGDLFYNLVFFAGYQLMLQLPNRFGKAYENLH